MNMLVTGAIGHMGGRLGPRRLVALKSAMIAAGQR
jgi:hypothetical protein